jgi:hypothetical protein
VRLAVVARAASGALALVVAACGYRPLYGGGAAGGASGDGARLHVVLVRSIVPDAIASDEVVSGVREELARDGALAAGDGYPRVEIEVLRLDESSDGIAAARPVAGGPLVPHARGTEVGVVARAWVVTAAGGEPQRDTGDVRALDLVGTDDVGGSASGGSLSAPAERRDAFRHADAVRATAHRDGDRLAQRVLGHPVAPDEAMGRER